MRFYFDIPEHISPLRRSPYLELVEITLKIQTNIGVYKLVHLMAHFSSLPLSLVQPCWFHRPM